MAIKSIFFDLDGTLWDCKACTAYVMKKALLKLAERTEGVDMTEECLDMLNIALMDSIIEGGLIELSQPSYSRRFIKLFERCGMDDEKTAGEMSSHCYAARRLAVRTFLKDDAHETLVRLKNKGIITGVITNGTPAVKRNVIDSLGLRDSLDYIVLGEAEGFIKPDMRLFSLCIELAGAAPEETLFVGDSFFTDILGAKRAGAKAMLLCDKKVKIPTKIPPPDFAMSNLKGVLKIV